MYVFIGTLSVITRIENVGEIMRCKCIEYVHGTQVYHEKAAYAQMNTNDKKRVLGKPHSVTRIRRVVFRLFSIENNREFCLK